METVRFTGGQHHGLIVQAPAHIAERLHAMSFEVLATGQLYDTARQCRIPGTRAVNATPQPVPKPAPVIAVAAPEPAAPAPVLDLTPPSAPATTAPRPAPVAMPLFQPARPS